MPRYGDFSTLFDYGSSDESSHEETPQERRDRLLADIAAKYADAGSTDATATGIDAVGSLLGALLGQPYRSVTGRHDAVARLKSQLEDANAMDEADRRERNMARLDKSAGIESSDRAAARDLERSRQGLEERRQNQSEREFNAKSNPTSRLT